MKTKSDLTSPNPVGLSPKEMASKALAYTDGKMTKSGFSLLMSAGCAGLFIGLAFVFYITVTTGGGHWGLTRFVGGVAFSLGLILVVIMGGELFTSSVLTSITYASKRTKFSAMLKYWSQVYFGNFVGAAILVALVFSAKIQWVNHGLWGETLLNLALHKLHHDWWQAFSLGLLCNLMVCLAVWLTFSSENPATKALLMVLPVALFVSSGFEHSIANLFVLPLALLVKSTANAEFLQQIAISSEALSALSFNHIIFANLVPVTLGNIVGGAVLVGWVNWRLHRPDLIDSTSIDLISKQSSFNNISQLTTQLNHRQENNMNPELKVNQFANFHPVTLSPTQTIHQACQKLIASNIEGAPVVDLQNRLLGFFSIHDFCTHAWLKDYDIEEMIVEDAPLVQDLMTKEVVTISGEMSVSEVLSYFTIDKEQLYPATSMGIATAYSGFSVEERLKAMQVKRPRTLPIVEGERLVAIVNRYTLVSAFYQQLVPSNDQEQQTDKQSA